MAVRAQLEGLVPEYNRPNIDEPESNVVPMDQAKR
jgi:hypothetical protein